MFRWKRGISCGCWKPTATWAAARWKKFTAQQHTEYRHAVTLLSDGDARGGLEALDRLGWVKESEGNYLKEAAGDYFRLTENGKNLDQCLVASPTWDENHRLTAEIRSGLKERGLLPAQGIACTVHDPLGWTDQQKSTPQNYQTGQVVTFNRAAGGWEKGSSGVVSRIEEGRVWAFSAEGVEHPVPLAHAPKFDVARSRNIEISPGDKILLRAMICPMV